MKILDREWTGPTNQILFLEVALEEKRGDLFSRLMIHFILACERFKSSSVNYNLRSG